MLLERLCPVSPRPAVTPLWDQRRKGPSWSKWDTRDTPPSLLGNFRHILKDFLACGSQAFGPKYTIGLACHGTIWRSFVITVVHGLAHTPSNSWRRTDDNYHENSAFIYSNTKKVLNWLKSCKIAFLNIDLSSATKLEIIIRNLF